MLKEVKKCPVCGKTYLGIGATSRKDNKTEICSQCGIDEAVADWEKYLNAATKNDKKRRE